MAEESIVATNTTLDNMPRHTRSEEPEGDHARRTEGSSGWLIAAVLVFLVIGFVVFRATGRDDSYISYWPAHTLAHYGRIINYSGEAIEQSSSLLWVLLLGFLAFVTRAPVPLLGPLLSLAGGILAILMAYRLAARLGRPQSLYALLLTATAPFLIYWSFSGMEASFVGACTCWLAVAYSDYLTGLQTRKTEILAATLCCLLLRPEMGMVNSALLAALIVLLWIGKLRGVLTTDAFKSHALRIGHLALIAVVFALSLAAVRMVFFHSPVPEPVLAKVGANFRLMAGVSYLSLWFRNLALLPSACLVFVGILWTLAGVAGTKPVNMTRLVCMCLLIAYGGFIIFVGGDWMGAARFITHVLPVGLVFAADTLSHFTSRRLLPAAGLAVILIQLYGGFTFAIRSTVRTSPLSPANGANPQLVARLTWFDQANRIYIRDAPVAEALDRVVTRFLATGHPVAHIFSGQMGFILYTVTSRHYRQIDVTDRFGLADHRLVGCRLVENRPRMANGLIVNFPWFLSHGKELESECGIPLPDIIYDVEDPQSRARVEAIHQNGYAFVYLQDCDIPQNRGWLPGVNIEVIEYIAVRRELLPSLGMQEIPVDQFKDGTR